MSEKSYLESRLNSLQIKKYLFEWGNRLFWEENLTARQTWKNLSKPGDFRRRVDRSAVIVNFATIVLVLESTSVLLTPSEYFSNVSNCFTKDQTAAIFKQVDLPLI